MAKVIDLYQQLLKEALTANPPKDHTTVYCTSWIENKQTGQVNKTEVVTKIYYKDVARYEDLPRMAQGELTQVEFARYKAWEATQK